MRPRKAVANGWKAAASAQAGNGGPATSSGPNVAALPLFVVLRIPLGHRCTLLGVRNVCNRLDAGIS
jgi:hypothetical protein